MLYNSIGEWGFATLLARRLTTGQPNPSPAIAPELFPTLPLEVDRPEWKFLTGTKMFQGWVLSPADAANLSAVSIYNPAGSGVLCVIKTVNLATATGLSAYRIAAPVAGTLGGSQPTDTRWGNPAISVNSTLMLTAQVMPGLPAGGEYMRFTNACSSNVQYDSEFVIAPGGAFQWVNRAVNNALAIGVQFYERTAQPGELV